MDALQWINQYWQILIFVGVCIGSWVKFNSDLNNYKLDMKAQKEEHDIAISQLKIDLKSNEIKTEALKDKLTESINDIQKNIVEIMTILKGNPKH